MCYKNLTDQEIETIAREFYYPRSLKTLKRDIPTATFVAAQPGAGKTFVANMAKDEARKRGGYIHIDADVMRARIPIGESRPTSEETQKDAGKLANLVRSLALNDRRNIIEEGTFRTPGIMSLSVCKLRELGYKVELLIVCASKEESLLGIFQRHEKQHIDPYVLNPRFVSEQYHNE